MILGSISGDLDGLVKTIFDAMLDNETGNGPARAIVKVCVAPTSVTVCEDGDFEGRLNGRATAFLFSGTFNLQGRTSNVTGTSIRGTATAHRDEQGNEVYDLTGTIHSRTR